MTITNTDIQVINEAIISDVDALKRHIDKINAIQIKGNSEILVADKINELEKIESRNSIDISLCEDNYEQLVTKAKLPVIDKSQGSSPICWAACIASIGQYRTGINKTPLQVHNAYYGAVSLRGANYSQVLAAFPQ